VCISTDTLVHLHFGWDDWRAFVDRARQGYYDGPPAFTSEVADPPVSVEEFEQWSVWETTTGGINVHTPVTDDPDHIRCDCPGGVAMHENEVWAQEKAEEIRAAGRTAVVKRRVQTWVEGPWVEVGVSALGAWVVQAVDHDETRSVGPIIRRNGMISRAAGQSDVEHTRYYAAQLLAAADETERRIAENEPAP
jgi:hypothetical protein